MKISVTFIFLIAVGSTFSASTSKQKIVQLRDALNNILNDNASPSDLKAYPVGCPFHSCTPDMLGCESLATNENGCQLCECAEAIAPPAKRADQDRGRCLLPPDSGPCKALGVRYYFDRAANQCQKFAYGGCKGNENNFEKLEECEAACVGSKDSPIIACPLHGCTPELLDCAPGTGLATNEYGCSLCTCQAVAVSVPESGASEVAPLIPCAAHSCTPSLLGCPKGTGLAKNAIGCEMCECQKSSVERRRLEEVLDEFVNK